MKKVRIMLALQKKLNCRQNEAKIKRVKKAIEVAIANAEEQKACAEDKLEDLVQNFNADTNVSSFVQQISRAMFAQEEAEGAIAQLKKVDSYLFEELDEPEEATEEK